MSYLAYVLADPPATPAEPVTEVSLPVIRRSPTALERVALAGALVILLISAWLIGFVLAAPHVQAHAVRVTYVHHPCRYFHTGQHVPAPFHCVYRVAPKVPAVHQPEKVVPEP